MIQTHLRGKGIKVILSGGAVVALYSDNLYVSGDLDFVNSSFTKMKTIDLAMREFGFILKDRYYSHPESEYFVEFPPGPLAVGMEPVQQVDQIDFQTGCLWVISPTDSVKDRLAAYYHWGDMQCFYQAVMIMQHRNVDLQEVRRWSTAEGKSKEFSNFLKYLNHHTAKK
jgi:hypothetical protein